MSNVLVTGKNYRIVDAGENILIEINNRNKKSKAWIFPKTSFATGEKNYLDMINNNHMCGGCATLPTDGGNTKNKYSWCSFSRFIAQLQDEY